MKSFQSIIRALVSKKPGAVNEFLVRRRRNRARRKMGLTPDDVHDDFFKSVESIADMQAFFAQAEPIPGPTERIPKSVYGLCYVCQQEVRLRVDTELIRRENNWRETMKCPGCGLINRFRSSIHVFETLVQPGPGTRIYITEAVTPLFRIIAARYPACVGSEYIEGIAGGSKVKRPEGLVRIEDVTRLSFEDGCFEAVLSFDVLEHVPDYRQALREFYRVLAPGGQALISVPFTFMDQTLIRAELDPEGNIRHRMEPMYHCDPLSVEGVLCYQDFGLEFLEELRLAGFGEASLLCFTSRKWGYFGAHVMFVAQK